VSTYVAGGLLILAGMVVWIRMGSATPLHVFPKWDWDKVNFWSQIAFAFGGLELGAVMGGEIRRPDKTVPRAALISGAGITGFYLLGTLALLVLLAPEQVNVMTGIAQAGQSAAGRMGFPWFGPLLAVLITAGLLGQLGAWVGGTARMPFVIGLDSYLPPAFAKLHPKWRTPWFSLLTQGAACSVFLIVMLLGENLQAGYQLLVDMTVVTYFIPFLYMFLCSWKCGCRVSASLGLFTTLCGIVFSLIPPAGTASPLLFELKLLGGCALLVLTGRMTFSRAARISER
jgi:amino acid transporter